jgi:microsomal dipeptidase-like Zn-dependent dipeptidase
LANREWGNDCEKKGIHCFLILTFSSSLPPRTPLQTKHHMPPANSTPKGIEDVGTYPYLFAELMGHGWSAEELVKLAGGNLLRVFSEVSAMVDGV